MKKSRGGQTPPGKGESQRTGKTGEEEKKDDRTRKTRRERRQANSRHMRKFGTTTTRSPQPGTRTSYEVASWQPARLYLSTLAPVWRCLVPSRPPWACLELQEPAESLPGHAWKLFLLRTQRGKFQGVFVESICSLGLSCAGIGGRCAYSCLFLPRSVEKETRQKRAFVRYEICNLQAAPLLLLLPGSCLAPVRCKAASQVQTPPKSPAIKIK
jgi:hypothetical protein